MPIAVTVEPPFAGLLIDVISGAVALIAALTGLFGGAAHYLAVLRGHTKRRIDVDTGVGFFFGMGIGTSVLVLELFV